jgi:hypothetical protein
MACVRRARELTVERRAFVHRDRASRSADGRGRDRDQGVGADQRPQQREPEHAGIDERERRIVADARRGYTA